MKDWQPRSETFHPLCHLSFAHLQEDEVWEPTLLNHQPHASHAVLHRNRFLKPVQRERRVGEKGCKRVMHESGAQWAGTAFGLKARQDPHQML